MSDLLNVHAVIPTLSSDRCKSVLILVNSLETAGATVTVVANGKRALEALENSGIKASTQNKNLGFSGSVNFGAELRPKSATTILIVNDDIIVNSSEDLAKGVAQSREKNAVVAFGDEPCLPIMRFKHVMMSVTLFSGIRRHFTSRTESTAEVLSDVPSDRYAPCSLAAIPVSIWQELEGLDERFPFLFEDVDFNRRCIRLGIRRVIIDATKSTKHVRGVTGRSKVDSVLPVAIWGAVQYLEKWGVNRTHARLSCAVALLLRVPLIPFTRTSVLKHFEGVLLAWKVLILDSKPRLPEYGDN